MSAFLAIIMLNTVSSQINYIMYPTSLISTSSHSNSNVNNSYGYEMESISRTCVYHSLCNGTDDAFCSYVYQSTTPQTLKNEKHADMFNVNELCCCTMITLAVLMLFFTTYSDKNCHFLLILILMSALYPSFSTEVDYVGSWITGDASRSTDITARWMMATGFWNDSIYIIGGEQARKELIEYNTLSKQMIKLNSYVDRDTWGYGQYWSQQTENLYMIDPSGDSLNVMNLATKTFTTNWQGININVANFGCLASTSVYLFITGGGSPPIDNLQVFDMTRNKWMSNTQSMIYNRYKHACIVHGGYLYVIGGNIYTIEKIKVNNMINIGTEQWAQT
eukprot:344684_1